MVFTHKLVAVFNKDISSGIVLNALAHIPLGLKAKLGADLLKLDIYKEKKQP